MSRSEHACRAGWLAALCAVFLVLFPALRLGAATPEEGKRVALIIGNDAYSMRPLQNAVNDARAMDKALRGAGFRTILKENATKAGMEEAVAELLDSAGPGDTVLFFYAGHAVQIQSENVLIPVDFETARSLIQAKLRSFSLAAVFDYLKQSRARTSIVIIDACRSNPVREQYSLQGGLALPLTAGKETYIAFSTTPNHVATDNPEGKNSWFTESLSAQIGQPALTIDEVFTRVRLHVEKATGGGQTPWSQTSLTAPFYFHSPRGQQAQTDAGLIGKWFEDAEKQQGRGNWQEALELLNRVAGQESAGNLRQKARVRLPYVTARHTAASRHAAGEFAAAADACEQALRLDPFAIDAAFDGVTNYLLTEQVPQAVALLKAIRARGPTAAFERATAMLRELAAIDPQAAQESKAAAVEPPGMKELFAGTPFGVPDWEAGRIYSRSSSMEMAKWIKEIAPAADRPAMAESQPQDPASPGAQSSQAAGPVEPQAAPAGAAPAAEAHTAAAHTAEGLAAPDTFHLELVPLSGARDLVVENLEGPGQFGTLALVSSRPDISVRLAGKQVASRLPTNIRLPAGKYEIRSMEQGRKLGTQEVEVLPGRTVFLRFK